MIPSLQLSLPHVAEPRSAPPLRRRVYRLRMRPYADGTYHFRSRSFTRDDGTAHRLSVNLRTGRLRCTCPDYIYRRSVEGGLCKHLRRAIVTAARAERRSGPRLRVVEGGAAPAERRAA